jgi:hypothetical protein
MAIGSPQWMYKSGEAYELDQSLKFNDDDSASLTRTPSSTSNRKTWTWSGWVKRGVGGFEDVFKAFVSVSNYDAIQFDSDGSLRLFGHPDTTNYTVDTTAVFRDSSAWYHFVVVLDTTESTASNRVKIYANGVLQAVSGTYPGLDGSLNFNKNTAEHQLATSNFDGYLAEVNFIDGQALTPSDFGETGDYGEWKPKEYSGTYGTNGFYLPFKQDYTVEGFSTVTYKSNGTYGHYIGGVGFKPDLTWVKMRSHADNHVLSDIVRGQSSVLYSNLTNAETTSANFVTAKNIDGFSVGTDPSVNYSSGNHVAWNWDMGADTPTGFGCVTYKGGGSNVSGFGFSPDLVWIKSRGSTHEHILFDTIRGATKNLTSVTTAAEWTDANGLQAFEPDGFSLGSWNDVNSSSYEYVSWGWDMGGTTVTNTSGSISSQVRANPTYGQSIVKWTGNGTTGHGLSSAPEMIIVKPIDVTGAWWVWHKDLSNTSQGFLQLNTTAAEATNSSLWDNASPVTSTTINANTAYINYATDNYIAYCFHSVSGYSKIGSYSGTGSTGNSVTTGFRPAFLLIKRNADEGWQVIDSTRNPLNTATSSLSPNSSAAERDDLVDVDFTSTGFTLQNTDGSINASGSTYIYMAFAGGMDSISDYNTTGDVDSRVKANPTYGQSIVSYTGNGGSNQTVGHGLSSTPDMVILKARDDASTWYTGHVSLGTNEALGLNETGAAFNVATGQSGGGIGARSSTTFTLQDGTSSANNVNRDGYKFIAYCFHSVTGYSKFGSYTGSGNASGNSVTLGFQPAFVMVKASSGSYSWAMFDNTRAPDSALFANVSNAEESLDYMDFTSTGFNLTTTHPNANASGQTYIYMAFADKREYAYWLDQSGNNNDWTSNNLTESDISVDSPSNNFATWNPLDKDTDVTVSEGNLKTTSGTNANHSNIRSTFSMSSGKWYAEFIYTHALGGSQATAIGIATPEFTIQNTHPVSSSSGFWGIYQSTGKEVVANGGNIFTPSAQTNLGDVIQIAFDSDAQKFWLGVNNVWYNSSGGTTGNPATGANATASSVPSEMFLLADVVNNATQSVILNAGQDSSFAGNKTAQGNQDGNDIGDFYYTPPTGFLALCTKNLPDVDVVPSEHFNTVLYTGTGSSQSVDIGFQTDFVWNRKRNDATNFYLQDVVRGFGASKSLSSNTTSQEGYDGNPSSQSLSVGSSAITVNGSDLNENNLNFVSWNWKANGSGSSNTNGSITSTVSANVDAGFSIVSYTGTGSATTVGHGLSKAPEFIVVKKRNASGTSWVTFSQYAAASSPENYYSKLEQTDNFSDHATIQMWGDTAPTASVFSIGDHTWNNGSSETYIGYCFHSVDGYSKVGSYTGNGNADGTFVYTGFRPAFIMVKRTDNTGHWEIHDTTRDVSNVSVKRLFPNYSSAEDSDGAWDILSNGFKFRTTHDSINASGGTYVYLCFAESPFKYSNAR